MNNTVDSSPSDTAHALVNTASTGSVLNHSDTNNYPTNPTPPPVSIIHVSSAASHTPSPQGVSPNSTTIGLVIHAAVDGIALGAVSYSQSSELELIIFMAIIMHKAPASVALSSYLLQLGCDREEGAYDMMCVMLCVVCESVNLLCVWFRQGHANNLTLHCHNLTLHYTRTHTHTHTVIKHLVIFSLSTPITALFTYVGLGRQAFESDQAQSALGLCLLFSAGTFLYVATSHILPEVKESLKRIVNNSDADGHSNHGKEFGWPYILALCSGILFPMFFSVHGH